MIDILSTGLIALGALLSIIGGSGIIRLPDIYSRLHAVGVSDTLCSFMILFGLALQSGFSLTTVKLAMIFGLLLFTSPASSYALGHSAWHLGIKPQSPEVKTQQGEAQ